jgi:hypothetical protein
MRGSPKLAELEAKKCERWLRVAKMELPSGDSNAGESRGV